DPDVPAAASFRLDFEAASQDGAFACLQESRKPIDVALAMSLGHDQVGENTTDGFIARPAEYSLGLRIPVCDNARFIHLDESIERAVDDPARHLFAFKQRS